MKLIDVLGTEFDNIGIIEAVERSIRAMENVTGDYVLLQDSQQTLQNRRGRRLQSIISHALLVLPGDRGIFTASRLLGTPLRHKMSVADYSGALLARMSERGMSVFILVARSGGIAQRAADDLSYRFPGVYVAGAEDISRYDKEALTALINEAAPDLLVLAMDYGEQMGLIYSVLPGLDVGLCLGLGRAMDEYTAKRGETGFFNTLSAEPARALKEPGIIIEALRKRIFG